MIKQKPVVIKITNASLTYSEIGDIVCNSTLAITTTLPAPNSGLWYRISNVGAGIVTVYYGSALITLKQTEQCLCLANSSTDWFFSKGGVAMSKAEIEEVLTGEISSHKHAAVGDAGYFNCYGDYFLDGGRPDSNYGGADSIDAGGV